MNFTVLVYGWFLFRQDVPHCFLLLQAGVVFDFSLFPFPVGFSLAGAELCVSEGFSMLEFWACACKQDLLPMFDAEWRE